MNIISTLTCSMNELRSNSSAGCSYDLTGMTSAVYARSFFIIDEEKTKRLGRINGWSVGDLLPRAGIEPEQHDRNKVVYANVLERIDTLPSDTTLLEQYYGFRFLMRWPSNDRDDCDIRCLVLENYEPEKMLSYAKLCTIGNGLRAAAISYAQLRQRLGLPSLEEEKATQRQALTEREARRVSRYSTYSTSV